MPQTKNPLENAMYISLPEDSKRELDTFTVDPDILIPVEIVGEDESWTMQNLSWEMIIAAMLKVITYDRDNSHASYYRDFILAAKPDIAAELSVTGVEQANQKNYDIAEEILAALRALQPNEPDPALNLALVYEEHAKVYEKGNRLDLMETYLDQTHTLYSDLLKRFPEHPRVHFNCGHFFLHMKNYVRAREHLEQYLELSDDTKKKEMVVTILDELTKQSESDEWFREAFDFIRLGREREGIDRIRRFIEVHSDVWNAWFLLGWAYRRLEMYQEGYDAFTKAVDLGSSEPDTLNELAICQMELGKYDECAQTLQNALRIDPENTKIVSNLGILALKQERIEEAKNYFLMVVELDPNDTIALHYLEFLRKN